MGLPQLIVIGLTLMELGFAMAKHGEYKNDTYNFWLTLTSNVITLSILNWGGFFK